jgi:hypothetical protein
VGFFAPTHDVVVFSEPTLPANVPAQQRQPRAEPLNSEKPGSRPPPACLVSLTPKEDTGSSLCWGVARRSFGLLRFDLLLQIDPLRAKGTEEERLTGTVAPRAADQPADFGGVAAVARRAWLAQETRPHG